MYQKVQTSSDVYVCSSTSISYWDSESAGLILDRVVKMSQQMNKHSVELTGKSHYTYSFLLPSVFVHCPPR